MTRSRIYSQQSIHDLLPKASGQNAQNPNVKRQNTQQFEYEREARVIFSNIALLTILQMQCRIITALIMRETRATFGTSQIGYVWAIITPTASIFILATIFSAIGRQSPFGPSLFLFFATGIILLHLFNRLGTALMTALEANRALLSYPPIKRTDVFFARAILIILTYSIIAYIILGLPILLSIAPPPRHIEEVAAAFVVTAGLGFGYGVTNALLLSLWDSWRRIEQLLTKPLFFISGIFYIPSLLPQSILKWLSWNPLLHAVEWVRTGYYSDYDSQVLDKTYLILVALCLIFIALAGERLSRRVNSQ